jgi:addiction module RelE/StbE family toxin
MIIVYHRDFTKSYKKLSPKVKVKLENRLRFFSKDEFNPVLNNHALKGRWLGYRSINVTGDFRAIFKRDVNNVLFVAVDTHSNLYG